MTYKEYITSTLLPFNVDTSTIELILLNQNLDASKEVTSEYDISILKRALFKEFSVHVPKQSSVSEGGYSVSWDAEAIKIWYSSLANEIGEVVSIYDSKIVSAVTLW